MKTIDQLIEESLSVVKQVRSGKLTVGQAGSINNAVRNVIGIQALRINYAQSRGEAPDIAALNGPKKVLAIK